MPSTAVSATLVRCKRCATVLRNDRKACPCCSLDANATANGAAEPASERETARKRPPRPAMKLCPICMGSFPEAELFDVQGQRVCVPCAERLAKGGSVPKPLAAPKSSVVKASAPAVSNKVGTAPPSLAPDPVYVREQEELLKKNMSTTWWVMLIGGIVNTALGALAYIGVAAIATLGQGMMQFAEDPAMLKMMQEGVVADFEAEHQRKPTQQEIDSKLTEMREARQAAEKAMHDQLFKAKLLSLLALGLGISFFVLLFFLSSYPFECSLTALILFTLDSIALLVENGSNIGMLTIFIKVLLLIGLISGAQAGYKIKQLRAGKA